tara:strand:- start:477 stop:725 length:249 start_codon:yes stop_codon:yes gene_type:complete
MNKILKNRIKAMINDDMVLDCEFISELYKKVIVKMEENFKDAHDLIRTHNLEITNMCDTAWNTVHEKHGLSHIYVPIGVHND